MNLRHIAKALGGTVSGNQVIAPGPHHSKEDRSMAVFIDPYSPDLFRVHSYAGDDWKLCRDYVKAKLGIEDTRQRHSEPRREWIATPKPAAQIDDALRTTKALAIWGEARNLEGTPGLTYLAKREIDIERLPGDLHRSLRWHPSCPWETGRHGCIVGLMTDALTGEPKAIHRTAVTPSGDKVGKKMLGPSGGCVIRLWPDEIVTCGLVLGEGIETTLAAATRLTVNHTRLIPAWAACSASGIAKLPVLSGIEALTILVDNDPNNVGQRAAAECSARWTEAGREVLRLIPDAIGVDFNDVVASRRAA